MAEQLHYRNLESVDELSDFFCGVPVMDEVLHDDLENTLRENHCDSYVVYDKEGRIVAFFALEYDRELILDDGYKEDLIMGFSGAETPKFGNEEERSDFEKSDIFYAVDISYLAVRDDMQRKGIGSMIIDIISDIAIQKRPNSIFITVDALQMPEYSAVGFYRKHRFQELLPPQISVLRMFMTNVE